MPQCHFENKTATKYDGATMPTPIRAYIKKSSLPQDRDSTQDIRVDIIPMSASHTIAPAITPFSSILETIFLPEPQIRAA